MRFVHAIDCSSHHTQDRGSDAAASAVLFGIVGGLVVALAIPTIAAVALGAGIAGLIGVCVAYH